MIKAIETVYNGYRFRSRLEARWAVFFDSLQIKYVYEPDGFDLEGTWYLPDFELTELGCYVEIKGAYPSWEEMSKAFLLAWHSGKNVYILWGNIGLPSYENGILSFGRMGLHEEGEKEITVIPLPEFKEKLASDNDISLSDFKVCKVGLLSLEELKASLMQSMPDDMKARIDLLLYYDFERWVTCPFCQRVGIFPYGYCTVMPCNCCRFDGWTEKDGHKTNLDSPLLIMAYNAARQKRFEHGENIDRVFPQPVQPPKDDPHAIASDKASDLDRQYFLDHPDVTEYTRPYIWREFPFPQGIQPDEVLVKQMEKGLRSRIPLFHNDTPEMKKELLGHREFVETIIRSTGTRQTNKARKKQEKRIRRSQARFEHGESGAR